MLFPNLIPKKLMKRFGLKISFGVEYLLCIFNKRKPFYTQFFEHHVS